MPHARRAWPNLLPRALNDVDRSYDHPPRDAARVRGPTDVHSFTALSLSAFKTTVKLDSAIAAPANIGDIRMPVSG